jgi:hypothetical protein
MDSSEYKMDSFIEKIVARKKEPLDYIQITAAIFLGIMIIFAGMFINIPNAVVQFMPFIWVAAIYGIYFFIRTKNIEFEYAVTNGDMDIDKIIARKKRKRIFSGHSKNFEIVAKVHSEKYSPNYASINKKIIAVSSMDQDDVYFLVTQFNSERTIVYFQPNEKMIKSFKIFIANKIFQ